MAKSGVKFTRWAEWSERSSLRGSRQPGIYMFARFRKGPQGNAKHNDEKVIYIAETSRSTISRRIREFQHAAFDNKGTHPAARNYRRAYRDDTKNLYVAIAPVIGMKGTKRAAFLRYIESKLLWEYTRRWGIPPKCNRG